MTVFEIVVHRNVDNWIQLLTYVSSRSVKTVRTNKFAKNACCRNVQLPILFFVKSIVSDMHHRIAYNRTCISIVSRTYIELMKLPYYGLNCILKIE